MGLSTALNTALTGLRATQTGLELVSANVANAETPGYTRKNTNLAPIVADGRNIGVRVTDIKRTLDSYVQKQLRTESSSLSYANIMASYTDRAQKSFGTPGTSSAFSSVVDSFVSSLDTLATSPESQSARAQVLSDAQVMAQTLNNLSDDVQAMRTEVNQGLQDATKNANAILDGLEKVSKLIAQSSGQTLSPDLLDQRDAYIAQLSDVMDIQVQDTGNNQISISTGSGLTLFANGLASTLSFDGASNVGAQSQYSTDPAERTIGTVLVTAPGGITSDLLNPKTGVRSGSMKAYAELRDTTLVQAQTQLDEIAGAMSKALGSSEVQGTPVVGPPDGSSIDLANLQPGDSFTLNYTEQPAGTSRTVTFYRVDDPASLPLSNDVSANPDDTVVGIDFSTGYADVATAVGAALGTGFTVSNPAGSTLEIVDDGGGTAVVDDLSASVTTTALQGTPGSLPFFVDAGQGNAPYTGSLDGNTQRLGYAGRIVVNPALLADSSLLVAYSPTTAEADATRPIALRDALESLETSFRTDTGIGGRSSPYTGSISGFAHQIVEAQSRNATVSASVAEGQSIVVTSLQDRFSDGSGVDVDDEMGHLIELQNAYAANARVISVVKEMFDLLMQA
jgi:flagellar hook-associated protein 1 FlgK